MIPDPAQVSLQQLTNYAPKETLAAMRQLLAPLGGMENFVKPGQKVLLKPNLLAGRPPEKAVTTHPEIVRAVIILVKEAGGAVSLGDSPGIGSPENVARKSGLLDIVEQTGVRFAPFRESVKVRPRGTIFHELEIAKDLLEADVIINLPKLKTHQMMGLTCAVKNMFGAVVGLRKPRLHLQAGSDKAFFALMLLELCEQLSPQLTIVDAVVGMEGDGPGSGDPVQIGALLAGRSPVGIDTVATKLVGMATKQVWTQQVARNTGRSLTKLNEINLTGPPLETLQLKTFTPAKTTDVNFGIKGRSRRYLNNALTARPTVDRKKCRLCNACVEHCPPQAMEIKNQKLRIDYNLCIRCFCCQELCPHGALSTKQGLLLKLHSLFSR
jgi:uncharacterized protein (DUF362 family)/Pyruvate/2-oxoacid:ferredoxin oxidoreductase delta subunit